MLGRIKCLFEIPRRLDRTDFNHRISLIHLARIFAALKSTRKRPKSETGSDASRPAAIEVNSNAAVAAVLLATDGIFTLREEQRKALKAFFSMENLFLL